MIKKYFNAIILLLIATVFFPALLFSETTGKTTATPAKTNKQAKPVKQTKPVKAAKAAPVPVAKVVEEPTFTPMPKPASDATKAANKALLNYLNFDDQKDFENASRGLIDKPEKLTIYDAKGNVVWDLEPYKKYITLDKPAPDTVNPSLWRHAKLNMNYGLFKVADKIYQVRGYDLSNITFIEAKNGWIVFDPLLSVETAKAAYELVTKNLGEKPILAVIYSHSHADHYGGVKGIVKEEDVKSGKVKIIAPEGFFEHAISENVTAGNAMSRRAIYMYGALLPKNEFGGVNAGLGQTNSVGTVSIIEPTVIVKKTGEKLNIGGVEMIFQMTPGTEAPAEMNTYFPQFKALWMAENTVNTLHNILTLRGAQVRDSKIWAHFIDETLNTYAQEAEVKFQSHHWPVWGNANIKDYLEKQRDVYSNLHNQSVNLMNKGYLPEEIAEMIELPDDLAKNWATRGYYGTLKHNAKAVYQRYMGWYNGNPSNLDNLPPVEVAKHYVEYMGGEEAVINRAKKDFDKGEYRWTAEVLKHVVFANPNNTNAKYLLADSLEQMGYQAEAGPWRSVYLQGAFELRNGVPNVTWGGTVSADTAEAMTIQMWLDYASVLLNVQKAKGKKLAFNVKFTDIEEEYGVTVKNATLHYGMPMVNPDVKVVLTRKTFNEVQLGKMSFKQAAEKGEITFEGRKESFFEFFDLLDKHSLWFNIVTP